MFQPQPNLFITALSLDLLYKGGNSIRCNLKDGHIFLRSLIDNILKSSTIFTSTYYDGNTVFDPLCQQQTTSIVFGARNLCSKGCIVHQDLVKKCSTHGKPWFEFYRCLSDDIYELTMIEMRLKIEFFHDFSFL